MFLHCVAENKAEVKVPWHKFRNQGNSLFLFRLVVGLISFVSVILLIGIMVIPIVMLTKGAAYTAPSMIAVIVLFVLVLVSVVIVFSLIFKFTEEFVVPVMYPCVWMPGASFGQYLKQTRPDSPFIYCFKS
jgi:hypothetical protein